MAPSVARAISPTPNSSISRQEAAKELLRRRAARTGLIGFTEYTLPSYQSAWHHILIANKLDAENAAENEGYREGIEGNKGPGVEPERYDVTSPVGQARLNGWNKGQAVLMERFEAKNAKQAETVQ